MLKCFVNALAGIGLLIGMSFGTTVSGTVTDSITRKALTDAVVSIGFGVNAQRDTTAADGVFSFDSVHSGSQTLKISMVNYTTKIIPLTVGSTPVTADVALVGIVYGSVKGVVSDTLTGLPISGAIVRIGNGLTLIDTTGADGAYSITNIRTGNQILRVSASRYTTKISQVTVVANTAAEVNFALVPISYGSVSGIITDSIKATPLAGAIVRIGIGLNARIDTTGADGKYQLAEVGTGSVVMIISATGFAARRDTLTISGTEPVTHNIALRSRTIVNVEQLPNNPTIPQIMFSGNKFTITNNSGAGKLSIFSLNGKCVYNAVFDKNSASVSIPSNIFSSGLSLIAQITANGKSWTQQILSAK
jgi:hypothetical protein